MRDTEEQPLDLSVDAVSDNVRRVVATALDIDEDEVKLESSLFELGAESLDLLDIAFRLEKDYRIQYPGTALLERAVNY
jgi:acyl carrier protein